MANRIVSGLGWTTASTVLRNLVGLLQIAILTRFLAKGDFGIVAVANLFVTFTGMFLDMGMSAGIIHRQNITNKEYSSLFWLNIFFGIALTSILYLLAPVFASGYDSADLISVIRLICFTIFLNAVGTQQRTFCQKKAYFKRLAVIESVAHISTFLVAFGTAFLGLGVYSLAYSTLAGAIVLNLSHFCLGLVMDSRLSFHFSIKETLPFLKIGVYQVGSQILDFFTRELDIIIVSATLGLEFLGVYNIAKRIPTALYSFIQPIVGRVFTPLFAEMANDATRIKQNYMKLSKSLSWVSFPMYMLLAALSPTIISIVFGADYIDGVPVMMVFCLKYAFNGVNGVCGALQVATGRTDIGLVWTLYLISSTAVVYYLTSLFGVSVFLLGVCFLTLLNAIVCWYMQFRKMVGVLLSEYLTIYTQSFMISTVLAVIVYFLHTTPSIIYAIVSSCLFITLYIILLLNGRDGKAFKEIVCRLPLPMNRIKRIIKK